MRFQDVGVSRGNSISKDPESQEVKRQEDQGHTTGLGSRAGVPEVTALATEGAWAKDRAADSLCIGQALGCMRWTEPKREPTPRHPGRYFLREIEGLLLPHLGKYCP